MFFFHELKTAGTYRSQNFERKHGMITLPYPLMQKIRGGALLVARDLFCAMIFSDKIFLLGCISIFAIKYNIKKLMKGGVCKKQPPRAPRVHNS